ncbi:MAG: S41 family peptidase [Fimbriimonadaceae bacterium]|nr:hypothetical protein [Chthonomonadaceae bacterium]MCO5296890.1 S41 family peptidase [Fimbriimonadaceae bacterium]
MRRLLQRLPAAIVAACLIAIAAPAAAQRLEASDKQEVLDAIERVLTRQAFVPGVDFTTWPAHLGSRRASVDAATTPRSFLYAVNRILREFGVSHCRVDLDEGGGTPLMAQEPSSGGRPASELTWLADGTAVVRVRTFGADYKRDSIDALFEEASKAPRLILDLRSNGGGLVGNLQHLMGYLLPPGSVMGTFVTRRTATAFESATGGDATDLAAIAEWSRSKLRVRSRSEAVFAGKIAVLVNRGTGSASEMAAAALRDVLGAPIVGSATAGAVLGSTYSALPHGFRLQYPAQDYVTAKGVRLEGHPLVPDAEVRTRGFGEKDPVLDAARQLLVGQSR